jgi:hypothetical protein
MLAQTSGKTQRKKIDEVLTGNPKLKPEFVRLNGDGFC